MVEAELAALFGDPAPLKIPCVFQVVALWQPPDGGERRVMRIGPDTPQSPTDAFVLSLARARAEAILTTGRILRDEPEVRYAPFGPLADALATWRQEVLGLAAPPRLIVLSRSPLPPHPGVDAATERWDTDALTAVKTLQDQGVRCIAVEAGPSTAAALYVPGTPLAQLLVSTCHAAALPTEVVGPRLVPEATLVSHLPRSTRPRLRREGVVDWTFALRQR